MDSRNLELLKERAWFDIPIVYNNGRRAILVVEKGTPGERAFKEAFAGSPTQLSLRSFMAGLRFATLCGGKAAAAR